MNREVLKTQRGTKMTLEKLIGGNYRDDMTVEEIKAALESVDVVPKATLDKATAEASDWKKKYRETLDEQTRKEEEQREKYTTMEQRLNEMQRDKDISEITAKFVGIGFSEELAHSTAVAQYDGDFETVCKNTAKYSADLKNDLESKAQANTPAPPAGNGKTPNSSQKQAQALENNDSIGFIHAVMEETE